MAGSRVCALRAGCWDLDVSGVLQRLLEDRDVCRGVKLLTLLREALGRRPRRHEDRFARGCYQMLGEA